MWPETAGPYLFFAYSDYVALALNLTAPNNQHLTAEFLALLGPTTRSGGLSSRRRRRRQRWG